MVTNTAESILGLAVISRGGRPTGGNCERGTTHGAGTLIGQTSLAMQPDVDIWGHFVLPAILGLTYPPRLSQLQAVASISPRLSIGSLAPATSLVSKLSRLGDSAQEAYAHVDSRVFAARGVGCVSLFSSQPPCGALSTSGIIPEPSRENTCSGCDKWPARTLLVALCRCADHGMQCARSVYKQAQHLLVAVLVPAGSMSA